MLKRPSTRRKGTSDQIGLNLVPIIDTMVALIAFMLFTTSFLALVTIESPFPTSSSEEMVQNLKEKPLQLTLSIRDKDTEIWSPFDKIPPKVIPNVSPGQPDIKLIHEALLAVKQKFPFESKIVLEPYASATYDILISVMDSMRMVDAGDPPLFRKDPATGNDQAVKVLFPDVIFGNLLGD